MPASGWYPDPSGAPGSLRWWDGQQWTEHTRVREASGGAAPATPEREPMPGAVFGWQPRTPRGRRGSLVVIGAILLTVVLVAVLAHQFTRGRSHPLDTHASTTGTGTLSPTPVATASGSRGTPLLLPTASAATATSDGLCTAGNSLHAPGGKHQVLVHSGVRITYPNDWNFRIDADQFSWLEDTHPYGSATRDTAAAIIVARQPHALPSDGVLSVQQNYRCWAIAGPIKAAQLDPEPDAPPRPITTNGLSGHELTVTQQAASGNEVTTIVRSYQSGSERVIVIAWTENPTTAQQAALDKALLTITPA